MGNRKDQTRASSLHQGRREALQKENKTVMAAFSVLAILTAYAAAGPLPTTEYNNHEPKVSTKPFRHTAPSVTCQTEYVVLWSTKYEEREVCKESKKELARTFRTTHARRSRRARLDRWPTRSAMMSLRGNVRLCQNKFASTCQARCASRCPSSSAILSTRSSRSGSADRRRRKFATYPANQKPHHLWHQVFLCRLCQRSRHQLLCRAHQLSTSSPPLKIPCHLISREE